MPSQNMRQRERRQAGEFADIVPGQTTEVYLDAGDLESQALRAEARQPALVMLQGWEDARLRGDNGAA